MGRAGSVLAAGTAALVALVPLYGDSTPSPVSHAEWARYLVRALDMQEIFQLTNESSKVFGVLSWRQSLAYDAHRYASADDVTVTDREGERGILADNPESPGLAEYEIPILKGGDYKVRVQLVGVPEAPAAIEVAEADDQAPLTAFTVIPNTFLGWADAGTTHLDPGPHRLSVLAPAGTFVRRIEVVPPCINPVEPLGGWLAPAITTAEDLAVTTLKAVDLESELPPADTPRDVMGLDFQPIQGQPTFAAQTEGGTWLSADAAGLEALAYVDLDQAGLYTVSVLGLQGAGQRWLADSCGKAVLCGVEDVSVSETPEWRVLMTREFEQGRHFFTVVMAEGSAVGRLRFERKKRTGEDYVATLERVGFDVGEPGPITRDKAVDAMNWIRDRRMLVEASNCGDIVDRASVVAQSQGLPSPTTPPGGGTTPPIITPPFPGNPQPPIDPPILPEQPEASPVQPIIP